MNLRTIGIIAIAAFIVSACTTNSDLLASQPISVVPSAKPADILAECIYSAAVGTSEGLNVRKISNKQSIHVSADQGQKTLALYDVDVAPSGTGSTATIRAAANIWGGTNEPAELHQILARCAR